MDVSLMPKPFTNLHNWYSSTIDSLKFANPAPFNNHQSSSPSLVYTYKHVFSGFCAHVSLYELKALKKSLGFISATKDRNLMLHTTYTPKFLNLNPSTGLWPAWNYGEDVIVGVIDSGVWPESESFKATGMPTKVPKKWKGTCEVGQNFNSSLCNAKLIGARYINKGLIKSKPNIKIRMNSARDTRGHGTHTSSIIAGNYINDASYFGYASGIAKGVAPRARLAIYKVSWDEGSYSSDALTGMDQAIADGVDIISISMSSRANEVPLHRDFLAIGSFSALEKGVLVSTSAGNKGSSGNEIIRSGYPWVLTVTAGTIDRLFAGTLALENGISITGWTTFVGNAIIRDLPLVYDNRRVSCDKVFSDIPYGIIICNGFRPLSYQIERIAETHALGAIFIASGPISSEIEFMKETPCPCILITQTDGVALIQYYKSTSKHLANMTFFQTVTGIKPAPLVAANALRGPSRFPGILKPDVMAPGAPVLAAWSPNME